MAITFFPDPQPDDATKERTVAFFSTIREDASDFTDRLIKFTAALPEAERDTGVRFQAAEKIRKQATLPELLRQGICLKASTANGSTPLHMAVWDGLEEIVALLLAQGADIEARNKAGNTPLHMAFLHRCIGAIKVLIAEGADIDARNAEGQTPLHAMTATAAQQNESMHYLIERGADMEARDDRGRTPLINAAQQDSAAEKMTILLTYGANIHARPHMGSLITKFNLVQDMVDSARRRYEDFVENETPPASAADVYSLLSFWPLADPKAPVDRAAHLRQMFRQAKWESPQQVGRVLAGMRRHGESAALCSSLQALAQQSPAAARTGGQVCR